MLIKMRNDNSTNTVASYTCEYFELIWAGVTRFMSYRQLAEIEGEVRKACALGDNISLADVCIFFGIEPGCDDDKLFFTQDFPLEFVIRESNEELLGASGPCKVWIVDFDYSPVMIEEEQEEPEKEKPMNLKLKQYYEDRSNILDDLSELKKYMYDNFFGGPTREVMDAIDHIYAEVSNLEV